MSLPTPIKKDGSVKKAGPRRERSGVEAATSKVMNLIGRLSAGEQRKVISAVKALTDVEV